MSTQRSAIFQLNHIFPFIQTNAWKIAGTRLPIRDNFLHHQNGLNFEKKGSILTASSLLSYIVLIQLILLSLPFIFGWGVVFSWKGDVTAKLEEAEGKIPWLWIIKGYHIWIRRYGERCWSKWTCEQKHIFSEDSVSHLLKCVTELTYHRKDIVQEHGDGDCPS